MITQVVLVVLVSILLLLQLDYLIDFTQYINLPYLKPAVVLTFTGLFLLALYLTYMINSIRKEEVKFRSHKYITVEDYERNKLNLSATEVQKLMTTK